MTMGFSIAGMATTIVAPLGKVVCDAGAQIPALPQADTICLTHAHIDHVANLMWAFQIRRLLSLAPQRVLAEAPILEAVERLVQAQRSFGQTSLDWIPVEVKPGSVVTLDASTQVRVFRSVHTTPTVGFILGQERNKLKPEFLGLTEHKIANLRRNGTEVTDKVFFGKWAFTGDTTFDVIKLNPDLLSVDELVLECTFIREDQRDRAPKFGHTHIQDILDFDLASKVKKLTLTHFSSALTPDEVAEALVRANASGLEAAPAFQRRQDKSARL